MTRRLSADRRLNLTLCLALVGLVSCAHTHQKQRVTCATSLSDEVILQAAQRWMNVARRGITVNELSPLIHRHVGTKQRDYAVVLSSDGVKAVEDIVIMIDCNGRVLNLPACCDLGECPDACVKMTPPGHQ
jgi:hypothetical protein